MNSLDRLATPPGTTPSYTFSMQVVNSSGLNCPSDAELSFDSTVVHEIGLALLALRAMALPVSSVTLSLDCILTFTDEGEPWGRDEYEEDADDGSRVFRPASYWLKVEPTDLSLMIWDEYNDDELHGRVHLGEVQGLIQAIEASISKSYGEMLCNLSGAAGNALEEAKRGAATLPQSHQLAA